MYLASRVTYDDMSGLWETNSIDALHWGRIDKKDLLLRHGRAVRLVIKGKQVGRVSPEIITFWVLAVCRTKYTNRTLSCPYGVWYASYETAGGDVLTFKSILSVKDVCLSKEDQKEHAIDASDVGKLIQKAVSVITGPTFVRTGPPVYEPVDTHATMQCMRDMLNLKPVDPHGVGDCFFRVVLLHVMPLATIEAQAKRTGGDVYLNYAEAVRWLFKLGMAGEGLGRRFLDLVNARAVDAYKPQSSEYRHLRAALHNNLMPWPSTFVPEGSPFPQGTDLRQMDLYPFRYQEEIKGYMETPPNKFQFNQETDFQIAGRMLGVTETRYTREGRSPLIFDIVRTPGNPQHSMETFVRTSQQSLSQVRIAPEKRAKIQEVMGLLKKAYALRTPDAFVACHVSGGGHWVAGNTL